MLAKKVNDYPKKFGMSFTFYRIIFSVLEIRFFSIESLRLQTLTVLPLLWIFQHVNVLPGFHFTFLIFFFADSFQKEKIAKYF